MRILGGYTLLERITSGPSSEIYIARDPRAPSQLRAVKLVRPKLARDPMYVDALLRDAPAAKTFRHRSAVETYDVVCAENEVLIVEQLVKARSLAELLERGEIEKKPLPRELVLWIAMEVAGLLEAMHRARWTANDDEPMWHGALSPFDVLIDGQGKVSVLGSGLGHARAAVAPALDRLPYVAPELIGGDAPTPLSDIYALAMMTYDALSGGRYFRRATVADTRAAILEGQAPRMSERTDYHNAIVDELLFQSMARWPESRPQSAAYVERALRSQVRASEESAPARLGEHVRRAFAAELEAFQRSVESANRRVRQVEENETADAFRPLGAPSEDLAFGGVTEPMQRLEPRVVDPEVTQVPDLHDLGSRTEPDLLRKPPKPKSAGGLSHEEDLLQPTDLLADLFESLDEEVNVTPAKTEPLRISNAPLASGPSMVAPPIPPPPPPRVQPPMRTPSVVPRAVAPSARTPSPPPTAPSARTPSPPPTAPSPPPRAPSVLPRPGSGMKPPAPVPSQVTPLLEPASTKTMPPPMKKPAQPPPRATSGTGKATTSGAAEVAGAPARFLEKLAALLTRYELGHEIAKAGPISGIEAHARDTRAPLLVLAIDLERIDDARLSREEWLATFDRIGSVARKVTSPLLPRMVESGSQGSVRFLVLDHVDGASLSLVIGRGKLLGTEPVRKIIASTAAALHHLHERGIMYCNVQAQALWLTREGSGRLIDFSMAAPIGGPLNALLPSNIFALSPEFLRGKEYGPASDQFALGALLYELLTQTRPFRGLDTEMIVAAIRDKDPLPPHTIDSKVDRLLSDVAMRALDKDPGRRFNSMAELARLISST